MKQRDQRAVRPLKGFRQNKPEIRPDELDANEAACLRTLAHHFYTETKLKKSEAIYQKIIKSRHANDIDYCRLSSIYLSRKEHTKGIEMLKRALLINPRITNASYNLSKALKDIGKLEEAKTCCKRALQFDEQDFDLLTLYGNILTKQNNHNEACSFYRRALSAGPAKAEEAHWNLGKSYKKLKNHHKALESFAAITAINPNHAQAWIEIGNIAKDKGHALRSTEFLLKALEIDQTNWQVHLNLMSAFHDAHKPAEALWHGTAALETAPNSPAVQIHCAQIFNHYCDFSLSHEKTKSCVWSLLNDTSNEQTGITALFPVESLHHDTSTEDHISYKEIAEAINEKIKQGNNQELCEELTTKTQIHQLSQRRKSTTNGLKVGFISGDFRQHVVMRFLLPLLKELAEQDIHVSLFSSCEFDMSNDIVNQEARSLSNSYFNIHEKSTSEAIQIIRKAKIDILIDLSGHTRRNRLDIFNHRAAPVQATWLGYPATTGARQMDFILVDDYLNNITLRDICSEEPISKAGPFLCLSQLPESKINPQAPEERNGYITFGTLNNPRKYTASAIKTWAEILLKLKNSKLLINRSELESDTMRSNLTTEFRKNGIQEDQLILNTAKNGSNFLDAYNNIDIALDTFPYTGTTTTIDTLWMGVPVITLSGPAIHQRASSSILYHCGLSDWICSTKEEYIEKSIRIAENLKLRQQWRLDLRQSLTQSTLFNTKKFSEEFVEALNSMTFARLKKLESQQQPLH